MFEIKKMLLRQIDALFFLSDEEEHAIDLNIACAMERCEQSVFMLSDSKVIGNCEIGNNVIIGANAYIKDTNIPDNSLVFGQTPNLVIKENRADAIRSYAKQVFYYE